MNLNPFEKIAREKWQKTEQIRENIQLDEYIIMPNHFHAIVIINRPWEEIIQRLPKPEQFGKPLSGSIPTIIGSYNSTVTGRINQVRNSPGQRVWRSNYYEHIIRNEVDLNKIRDYIKTNPLNWSRDKYHA